MSCQQIVFGGLSLGGWAVIALLLFIMFLLLFSLWYFLFSLPGILRYIFRRNPGKDYPSEVEYLLSSGEHIFLKRVWFRGGWRYILKYGLPEKFVSPEEEDG